jgi:hypothetical protein
MVVQDGEGPAALAFAGGPPVERDVIFEIHLPQKVGRPCFERLGSRRHTHKKPAAPQNVDDRARRRDRFRGGSPRQ